MSARTYSFEETLAVGKMGESACGKFLQREEGWILLPAYEIEIPSGKGPRLFLRDMQLVVPDILAMKHKGKRLLVKWYECKNKSCFTWRYSSKPPTWQDGIDERHYLDYIKVQKETGIDVYILFLHTSSIPHQRDLAAGCPSTAPTGLFGQTLTYLMQHVDHTDGYYKGSRKCPMVYWNFRDLERVATLEQVQTAPISLWADNDHPF